MRNTGRDFYLITPRGELRVLRPSDVVRDVVRVGATRIGRMPPNGAAIGHAVKLKQGIDERMTMRPETLPTESRGGAPVG